MAKLASEQRLILKLVLKEQLVPVIENYLASNYDDFCSDDPDELAERLVQHILDAYELSEKPN